MVEVVGGARWTVVRMLSYRVLDPCDYGAAKGHRRATSRLVSGAGSSQAMGATERAPPFELLATHEFPGVGSPETGPIPFDGETGRIASAEQVKLFRSVTLQGFVSFPLHTMQVKSSLWSAWCCRKMVV